MFKNLKDGGTRQEYATGALKEDSTKTEGKGFYHLIPPMVIRELAEVYRKGAIKYGERNYEQGIPLSRYLDSAKRHLDQFHEGLIDENHLVQCIWNCVSLRFTQILIERGLLPPSLNDLPSYGIGPDYREPGPGLSLPNSEKGKWSNE